MRMTQIGNKKSTKTSATTTTNKIDILMSLIPDSYIFRGKQKNFSEVQREAISYCLYLIDKGWGITCATNRSGYKHNVSVQLLKRTIKSSKVLSFLSD